MAEEIILPIEPQRRFNKRRLILVLVILLLAAVALFLLIHPLKPKEPVYKGIVPQNVARAVNFKVYYPDPAKLPAGYTLDKNSFTSPVKNGVAYTVSYDNGKKMVFSVQTKPADTELQSFNANYIPLKLDFQTSLGQGAIGAYQGETLASLPIINGPWIIVKAPADVNQEHLKQVLRSLKTDR